MRSIRLPKTETILPSVLRGLAWLHCGLVAGLLCTLIFTILPLIFPVSLSPQAAFWRGLLFAIPAGLCYHAIKRQPALWQFLLTSLLLCALCWLLMGHPGGAVMMALMCLFRLRARLAEEDDGPVQSMFDQPLLPALALFAAAWLASAIFDFAALQKLSLLGGVLYLLVCLCYSGLSRVDNYLRLNRTMSGLPARRIGRIAGSAALALVLVTGAFLLPVALTNPGNTHITLPEQHLEPNGQLDLPVPEEAHANGDMAIDLSQLGGQASWQLPEWVSYLLFGVIGVILVMVVIGGVISVFKNFRRSFTDSRDVIQSLAREDKDETQHLDMELKKPRIWDRSHTASVRRRYRRAILKGTKELPKAWHTPAELETAAQVQDISLHQEYEQVRYGKG